MVETLQRPGTQRRGELQDTIRKALLTYGEREISVTPDDLIGKTGYQYPQVIQTLYRLSNAGEIELLREDSTDSARPRIVGVKLLKMEPKEEILAREEERAASKPTINHKQLKITDKIPHTLDYIDKKAAIERARLQLMQAGVDADTVIAYEPEPFAEEAMWLLQEVIDLTNENKRITLDLEAAQRDNTWLRQQQGIGNADSGT